MLELSDAFFDGVRKLASKLGCKPVDLLAVMYFESGCAAHARNKATNAFGLIQFMPNTLKRLGWTDGEDFLLLTAEEQLPYVEKYFAPYGKLPSLAHLYCAVFMPAEVPNAGDLDTIVVSPAKRSFAYKVNAVLDRNKDGAITIGEMVESVKAGCYGYRWDQIMERARLRDTVKADGFAINLEWIQRRLNNAGANLTVDGIMGNKTQNAIKKFQQAHGLVGDGIPGPKTLEKLKEFP